MHVFYCWSKWVCWCYRTSLLASILFTSSTYTDNTFLMRLIAGQWHCNCYSVSMWKLSRCNMELSIEPIYCRCISESQSKTQLILVFDYFLLSRRNLQVSILLYGVCHTTNKKTLTWNFISVTIPWSAKLDKVGQVRSTVPSYGQQLSPITALSFNKHMSSWFAGVAECGCLCVSSVCVVCVRGVVVMATFLPVLPFSSRWARLIGNRAVEVARPYLGPSGTKLGLPIGHIKAC
jgi:hypothetical protein